MLAEASHPRTVQRLLVWISVLALSIAACSPGAIASPRNGNDSSSPTPSLTLVGSPTASAGVTASAVLIPSPCNASGTNVTRLHQAPEVEAFLPASVAGRPLARWSVRGRCWAEVVLGERPADIDRLLEPFATPSDPSGAALADLTYGVAGRSDTKADPPYFVFVAARPRPQDQVDVALVLLFAGAGFHDVSTALDLTGYDERTIAGKQVYVGTEAALDQGEHQRGRPYLYQNDTHMFMVITDDDRWAVDAIGQLP